MFIGCYEEKDIEQIRDFIKHKNLKTIELKTGNEAAIYDGMNSAIESKLQEIKTNIISSNLSDEEADKAQLQRSLKHLKNNVGTFIETNYNESLSGLYASIRQYVAALLEDGPAGL